MSFNIRKYLKMVSSRSFCNTGMYDDMHDLQLNWTGVTVERGQASVHFNTHSHKFHPVPIGLQAYPRQVGMHWSISYH